MLHPPGEQVWDTIEVPVEVEISEEVDGQVHVRLETQMQQRQIPRMRTVRRQNVLTGKVESVQVPVQDSGSARRTVMVQLRMGEEQINKALCEECFAKFQPLAEELWKSLEKLKSY